MILLIFLHLISSPPLHLGISSRPALPRLTITSLMRYFRALQTRVDIHFTPSHELLFSFIPHTFTENYLCAKSPHSSWGDRNWTKNSENDHDNVSCDDIPCSDANADRQQSVIGARPWQLAHFKPQDNATRSTRLNFFGLTKALWQDFTGRPIAIGKIKGTKSLYWWGYKTLLQAICLKPIFPTTYLFN